MTIAGPCKIDGCHRSARPKRSGLCEAHYKRKWRYGDPSAGGTFNGDPARHLKGVVLRYNGDECLIWPFTRNNVGYAQISVNCRMMLVTRIVCEKFNGPPPNPDSQAAHSCGNGHLGCVTPGHLSWKDRPQNMADKYKHGTDNRGSNNPMAKITKEIAHQILELGGEMSQRAIASRVGISQASVGRVLAGDWWGFRDE